MILFQVFVALSLHYLLLHMILLNFYFSINDTNFYFSYITINDTYTILVGEIKNSKSIKKIFLNFHCIDFKSNLISSLILRHSFSISFINNISNENQKSFKLSKSTFKSRNRNNVKSDKYDSIGNTIVLNGKTERTTSILLPPAFLAKRSNYTTIVFGSILPNDVWVECRFFYFRLLL